METEGRAHIDFYAASSQSKNRPINQNHYQGGHPEIQKEALGSEVFKSEVQVDRSDFGSPFRPQAPSSFYKYQQHGGMQGAALQIKDFRTPKRPASQLAYSKLPAPQYLGSTEKNAGPLSKSRMGDLSPFPGELGEQGRQGRQGQQNPQQLNQLSRGLTLSSGTKDTPFDIASSTLQGSRVEDPLCQTQTFGGGRSSLLKRHINKEDEGYRLLAKLVDFSFVSSIKKEIVEPNYIRLLVETKANEEVGESFIDMSLPAHFREFRQKKQAKLMIIKKRKDPATGEDIRVKYHILKNCLPGRPGSRAESRSGSHFATSTKRVASVLDQYAPPISKEQSSDFNFNLKHPAFYRSHQSDNRTGLHPTHSIGRAAEDDLKRPELYSSIPIREQLKLKLQANIEQQIREGSRQPPLLTPEKSLEWNSTPQVLSPESAFEMSQAEDQLLKGSKAQEMKIKAEIQKDTEGIRDLEEKIKEQEREIEELERLLEQKQRPGPRSSASASKEESKGEAIPGSRPANATPDEGEPAQVTGKPSQPASLPPRASGSASKDHSASESAPRRSVTSVKINNSKEFKERLKKLKTDQPTTGIRVLASSTDHSPYGAKLEGAKLLMLQKQQFNLQASHDVFSQNKQDDLIFLHSLVPPPINQLLYRDVFKAQFGGNIVLPKFDKAYTIEFHEQLFLSDQVDLKTDLITQPLPPQMGQVEFIIRKERDFSDLMVPKYQLYIENHKGERLLLLSAKKKIVKSGTYLGIQIGEYKEDAGRHSWLGKLRSAPENEGTFILYDNGENPGQVPNSKYTQLRKEMGMFTFFYEKHQASRMRRVSIVIPQIIQGILNQAGEIEEVLSHRLPTEQVEKHPVLKNFENETLTFESEIIAPKRYDKGLYQHYNEQKEKEFDYLRKKKKNSMGELNDEELKDVQRLKNPMIREFRDISPSFNQKTKTYSFNFHGRVNEASKKNVQVAPIGQDKNEILKVNIGGKTVSRRNCVMQFGKRDTDTYILDFQFPFSIYQAFGFALSSFEAQ